MPVFLALILLGRIYVDLKDLTTHSKIGPSAFLIKANKLVDYWVSMSHSSSRSKDYSNVKDSIQFVNRLDDRFELIAGRISNLDKMIEKGDLESLKRASDEIKSVISDLTVLKSEENLNEKNSGGVPFRVDVDNLFEKTTALNQHLNSAIAYYTKELASKNNSQNNHILLRREEIAKLLLLTGKSYNLKLITQKQKGHIKDQICHRLGYLRLILQQDDISLLLGALSAVGGEA